MNSNDLRNKLERAIVRTLVEECAKVGLVPVTVWNGEEYAPQGHHAISTVAALTADQVIEHVFSVDESTLHFAPADDLQDWGTTGVLLIGGNGEDIISDYHTNEKLDAAVQATMKRIESAEVTL